MVEGEKNEGENIYCTCFIIILGGMHMQSSTCRALLFVSPHVFLVFGEQRIT